MLEMAHTMLKHLFLLLLFISQPSYANTWELATSEHDVQIYTRPQAASALDEVKGVVFIQTTRQAALALITNAEAAQTWMHNSGGTTLLTQIDTHQALIYTVIKTPWPLLDRDAVVDVTLQEDPQNHSMRIDMRGLPDYLPKKDDKVRIPRLTGAWLLEPQEDGILKVTYELNLDPGGDSPTWLVNTFSADSLHQTLVNLRTSLSPTEHIQLSMLD